MWTGVFSRSPTRDGAIATQLTLGSVRYESAAPVVRPRRARLPHGCAPPRAPILTLARRIHVSVAALAVLPRRVTRRELEAAAACHPPDPFMEQLHVAMFVVGRQAAGVGATPALPQRSPRRCPGSGQVTPWDRGASAIHRSHAAPTAIGPRRRRTAVHAGQDDRPPRAVACCRCLPRRRVRRRCDMQRTWCRMVRIVRAVRALDWA
jgi:hypothetical protein